MSAPTTDELIECALQIIEGVQKQVLKDAESNPKRYFSTTTRSNGKLALTVDSDAENSFDKKFRGWHHGRFHDVTIHGEESLTDEKAIDLRGKDGTFAIADLVDGT